MTRTTKPAPVVTWLPPVNPDMQKLGTLDLIAHGEKGEQESIAAGLELLRRKGNTQRRKAAEAKAA